MNKIPFNSWSQSRIEQGRKFCTSRKKKYNDPRVIGILFLPWGLVKEHLWSAEGADSPEELQQVIDDIFKRKVNDDEFFHVHFGDFNERGVKA